VILITSVSQLAFSLSSGPASLELLRAIDRTGIEMRGEETGEAPADTRSDARFDIRQEVRKPT